MLARIRKSMEDKDQGFTLIELLVVMIIIGILAAIAIPVFLNQRKSAVDSAMKSDLRSAAAEMETQLVQTGNYPATPAALLDLGVSLSNGNDLTGLEFSGDGGAYCLTMSRDDGAQPGTQDTWVYDTSAGGLQPADDETCKVV